MDNKTNYFYSFIVIQKNKIQFFHCILQDKKSFTIKLNPNINIDKSSTKFVFDTRHCCLPL
jgi:hypothetical protein